MKWSAVFGNLPTALIVERAYGLTDKKSRAYKSASREVQRQKKAEREGKEIKSKPETRERFERAAEQIEKEKKEKERLDAERAAEEAQQKQQLAVIGRAYNELTGFDPGTKVVVTLTRKDGTGLTLGRHGGVDVQWLMSQTIPGGISSLAGKQGYAVDPADWALIEFTDYEEY